MTTAALVHDSLVGAAAPEQVLDCLCEILPDANLYTLFADPAYIGATPHLASRHVATSLVQRLPGVRRRAHAYLPLMPLAVEQFDFGKYEMVVSSSRWFAKGIITGPDQLHICYLHAGMRHLWDGQAAYLSQAGVDSGAAKWLVRAALHRLRGWDYRSAATVDHFVTGSRAMARRVEKIYRRQADVIYPPVDLSAWPLHEGRREPYFVTNAAADSDNRLGFVLDAFAALPQRRLIVIGQRADVASLRAGAAPNVTFSAARPGPEQRAIVQQAGALIHAGDDEFDAAIVAAQACGTPAILLARDSQQAIVRGLDDAQPTGVLFARPERAALDAALQAFDRDGARLVPQACHANAQRFARARFVAEARAYIDARREEFRGRSARRGTAR